MKINDSGFELIKQFEGCKLKAYKDVAGIWTIGYGHTGSDVSPSLEIDQPTADAYLCEDVGRAEESVERYLKKDVNSNQFSAMVCLAYNIGIGNFKSSTLLKKVNCGDFKGAAEEFVRWNKSRGQVVSGLTRRRLAERTLFSA